jgi:periplasmic protein TonB
MLTDRSIERRATACVSPTFPALARQARLDGYVRVGILVDETGRVACVHLISGHPLIISTAIEAARQWKFRPATQNSRPVSFYGILAFHYSTSGQKSRSSACLEAHW